MTIFFRFALSGYLLWVVWHHAHWSVATAITLSMIANECEGVLWRKLAREGRAPEWLK